MRAARPWMLGIAILLAADGGAIAAPLDYVNGRFGYVVTYPADLYSRPSVADNDDGFTVLSARPASELLVWGSHNALDWRSAYQAACPDGCTGETYRVDTRLVGVSSGRDAEGIYYLKCVADRALSRFACFRLRYREADKARFDPVVEMLGRSLRLLDGGR